MTKIKTKKTYGKIDIRKNVRKFQYNTFLRLKVRYERGCPLVTHKLTHIFAYTSGIRLLQKNLFNAKYFNPWVFYLKNLQATYNWTFLCKICSCLMCFQFFAKRHCKSKNTFCVKIQTFLYLNVVLFVNLFVWFKYIFLFVWFFK